MKPAPPVEKIVQQILVEAMGARREYGRKLGQWSRCPTCRGDGARMNWRPGDKYYDPQTELVCPDCEGTGRAEDTRR